MERKPTVYVETTIPSYLTSDPSRDIIIAANQQITHTWWRTAEERFECFVSDFVMEEISSGNPDMAEKRCAIVKTLPRLRKSDEILDLVEIYRRKLGLTGRAQRDLPHLAYSVMYDMDIIVSWNCSHIANGWVVRRLQKVNDRLGLTTPVVFTPQSLLREEDLPDSDKEMM